jgi:hypothetical protein
VLVSVLAGCTRFMDWHAVHTGDPGRTDDHVVVRDGVTLRAHRFGLWNSHRPELALEIRNEGEAPVRFDPGACRLTWDRTRLSPTDAPEPATIAPGDRARWELDFPRVELPTAPDTSRIFGAGRRISVEALRVELPPLVIGDREELLPGLMYANPWLD